MFKIIARILITLILASGIAIACYYGYPAMPKTHSSCNKSDIQIELKKLQSYSAKAKLFCKKKGFNCNKCFFADMSLPGGKNRLFEYDMLHDSVISCGLVAHGSVIIYFLVNLNFQTSLVLAVLHWAGTKLVVSTMENLELHINYMDWIPLTIMLIKETLFYIVTILYPIKKLTHCLFVIAWDVQWYQRVILRYFQRRLILPKNQYCFGSFDAFLSIN